MRQLYSFALTMFIVFSVFLLILAARHEQADPEVVRALFFAIFASWFVVGLTEPFL